jgi:hypothetical protein
MIQYCTASEKFLVSVCMSRILIRDCIRRIRRFFVSETDTKHEYEKFLVRCIRHKEWPKHLILLFLAKYML